ncbi:MAG TPA: polysaccharide biosynthesis/export family protein [Pirellulales bacterium]|nr:polysaccharide biosynthesis/export family protein [Pirellulales bacterium]|tara:strand:+ start:213 stop:1529 length:1317 start_codon:yes stop_codon:yes gene_type:complete
MNTKSHITVLLSSLLLPLFCGCHTLGTRNFALEDHLPPGDRIPNEEYKTTLPKYVIEPPDILMIDALRVVPKAPYILEPLDIVQIESDNVLPDYPIGGEYQIDGGGKVSLGSQYGKVKIAGLTVEEAEVAVQDKLLELLVNPTTSLTLVATTGSQQIMGEHLVTPDGLVHLGTYGQVYVAGLTLEQAKAALEKHLDEYLESPEVIVDVAAYNSKFYYVITDGAGLGDQVVKLPIAGGETVLDAISEIGGLGTNSTKDIWVARPSADHGGYEQRLPINWDAIVKKGITATNYQLFPNDRIYIRASELNRIDSLVARATAPVERIAGTMFLLTASIRNLGGSFHNSDQNNLGNFFSDERLKTDLQLVGTSPSGINIYHFRYRGDMRRFEGVIAQELLMTHPEAVMRMPNGYYAVKYDVLDVTFRELTGADYSRSLQKMAE